MGTTALGIVIDVGAKTITVDHTIAIRETVDLTLTGYGSAGASSLRLGLIHKGTLVASCNIFTVAPLGYTGTLDLNTEEIVAVFAGKSAQSTKNLDLAIWDIIEHDLLVNDKLAVQNNPYQEGMDEPTAVAPIGGVTDYAPLDMGVTGGNSHAHSNSDGATINHEHLSNKGTRTHLQIDQFIEDAPTVYAKNQGDGYEYRFSGGKLYMYCTDDSSWTRMVVRKVNGVYVLSPQPGEGL